MKPSAVAPLMTMPIMATQMTVISATGAGIAEALDGFPDDRAAGDQQQHGVGQRRQDRRPLHAVGVAVGRQSLGQG
jgi:hypothetical protein